MAAPVFVASAFVAQYPSGGGNFWVPLQYVLGLRALGVDAHWLELLWGRGDTARTDAFTAGFLARIAALGLAAHATLVVFPDGGRDDPPGRAVHHGLGPDVLREHARDALLLNLANSVPGPYRGGFGRTALLDLDPGPFQLWAREHDLGVGMHDVHVTIGKNLGAPDSPVPLGGVAWGKIWPVVHLPAWPARGDVPAAPYTTVTQWWTNQYAFLDGETYDCNKRPGFLALLDLPRRVPVALELAANLHPGEVDDRRLLDRHGWRLADPAVVAGTPETFRDYVQGSRGELSCAKPAYVKARPGWVSDRTICYLASARPCVVEATGAERHLPSTPGLQFFRSLDEAADALRAVEADYTAAARAARRLAEEVFAADVVLPELLALAGA
ncbi:MAG TPA: hypothetical protein VKA21_02975 [Candidatus Binatia bacterium]|nr:hypothetical protein [Candidatus Binatia bacterium]